MDHLIKRCDLKIRIGHDWKAQGCVLGVVYIRNPFEVLFNAVGAEPNGFDATRGKLFCQLRGAAHFRCAHRRKVRRVAEEKRPVVADPFMEGNRASCGFRFEVGYDIAK